MAGLADAWSLPYVFEHEGLFVFGVSALIVALLFLRGNLRRRLGKRPIGTRPKP
jgi:hypothetical protein